MTAKDFKLIITSLDEEFKLYVKSEKGLVEVKNFELNIKDGYMVLNPKPY